MLELRISILIIELIDLCWIIFSLFYMILYFKYHLVETITQVFNYIDAFEVVVHKNIKSTIKIIVKNKDNIYKISIRT